MEILYLWWNEIIKNSETWRDNFHKILFGAGIIIINRATDKIFKTIESIIDKNLEDISII